jgi:alpha-beta hydrolase superfamily lysophospholipase
VKASRGPRCSAKLNNPPLGVASTFQAAYAVEAADNGKAVFIEKPMALTHADAQTIIDAEARNKVSPARSASRFAPREGSDVLCRSPSLSDT